MPQSNTASPRRRVIDVLAHPEFATHRPTAWWGEQGRFVLRLAKLLQRPLVFTHRPEREAEQRDEQGGPVPAGNTMHQETYRQKGKGW